MKPLFIPRACIPIAGITLLATMPSHAVLNFVANTWAGDGAESFPVPGTNPNSATRITGFTSGSFDIPSSSLLQSRFLVPTGVNVNYSVNGGGTANIVLANSTNFDAGANAWDGIRITNFSGVVSSVTITLTYTNPIAARDGFVGGRVDSGPVGSALGLVAGTLGDFNINTSFGGILTAPDALTQPTVGSPAGLPNVSAPFLPVSAGDTSFTNPTGFAGLVPSPAGGLSTNFLMVDGWDGPDPGTTRDDPDSPLTYITTQTWTIDPEGAGFTDSTDITISMDGQQYSNLLIPEPSGSLLALMGSMVLFLRRKR